MARHSCARSRIGAATLAVALVAASSAWVPRAAGAATHDQDAAPPDACYEDLDLAPPPAREATGTVPRDFDCGMRVLAVEFAGQTLPRLTAAQLQMVADALDGAQEAQNCTTPVPPSLATIAPAADARDGVRALPRVPLPAPGTAQYYCDAVHGSDSASGSEAHPFMTIAKGVDACAAAGSSACTVVLRAGTFYQPAAIELSAANSGLTIQAYTGEEVWVSGGVLLSDESAPLTWSPFNVSQGGFVVQQGVDAVWDTGPTTKGVVWGDKEDTWQACQAHCVNYTGCTAFTWHDDNQGKFANDCVLRTDGEYENHPQSGHVSGYVSNLNVYVADLSSLVAKAASVGSGAAPMEITGLRVNGGRAIRARYPNANPETQGFGSTLQAASWKAPTTPRDPDTEVHPKTPFRNTSTMFQQFQLGIGGPCEAFEPQAGYWCGNMTGGGGAATFHVPMGMTASKAQLPHSPYYSDVKGAVVQAWRPAHWASWMYTVGDYDPQTGEFTFDKGGFQGGRGDSHGDEFYIEGVMEELDFPGEYYYDMDAQKLYLNYNGTGAPPADLQLVATHAKVLFNASGTMAAPVSDISFRGLGFRDTAYTYMDPHGMPSGGDWALQRTAALFFDGTEGATVDSCTFERLDGVSIMFAGYARNAQVTDNNAHWLGGSFIAQWGDTTGAGVPGMGWDGTAGTQPRGTTVSGNFVSQVGIWEKQSSPYFQAKSCQNMIKNNVFFNMPRAGINFNDGFGGGSVIEGNLLFNTCAESGDHGPFNSWDRQVYNWNGTVQKAYDEITGNFIVANYNGQEGVDNDDGSAYYSTHDNFMAYGTRTMKNDFGGHSNHHFNNVYAFTVDGYFVSCTQLPGQEDLYYNNTSIMLTDGDYGHGTCSGAAPVQLHNNRIFQPKGDVTECGGESLKSRQAAGHDMGTTGGPTPPSATILQWAKDVLRM